MTTNSWRTSPEAVLRATRNDENAGPLEVGRAEFNVWYNREAVPAYNRLVELEKKIKNTYDNITEIAETLNGSRNVQSRPKAAVRFQDLRELRDFPTLTSVRQVTSAPTAADFNALVNDVQRIYTALAAIGMIVGRQHPQ